ncbi:quinone oxidoreductase family protein [Asticcacaulis excentricus]|uniref:Alcohol dehydrogenase zinc-binding domain protein n=1 Tax=Asticcacaulis excentricus (strain ATCC 15261 / DSM 4724 / KCTC 12464 / NCIMB 9791 / VKM B-1370 / CB 48) TaxID=573065 RepID=E8RQI7_ASTEC|nr:quinone oxidoreductase [Asticcacaulis excentricus]ADU12171.1 Alcohol dehydrogenase zinc-binding domain protein [Asticcacaulis excentricus CB 48]
MTTAIRVHETGGPEVLRVEQIDIGEPGPGEARVRHTAIGVNFIDTYFRSGLYKTAMPFVPGNEGAGIVEAVGEGVNFVKVGDRVVYSATPGGYAQARLIAADKLIPIPDGISDEVAAAVFLKGLTAQYLLRRTFRVGPGHTVLIHAAAGGVGLIAGQWARALGATVIGTAGSEAKIELARHNGYSHLINYRTEDFVARVLEITGGRKVDVVYDSVGKDTFDGSLDVLKPLGLMVSFGQSSGAVPPVDISVLNTKGSLFLTRPSVFGYNLDRATLLDSAADLFGVILNGKVRVRIDQRFALTEARAAHEALESRATTGSTLLIP